MPIHGRPKRRGAKALTKVQQAERDAKHNAEREKARRASAAESATKKRTAKHSIDSMTAKFAEMKIHDGGRRKRLTRRRRRNTRKA